MKIEGKAEQALRRVVLQNIERVQTALENNDIEKAITLNNCTKRVIECILNEELVIGELLGIDYGDGHIIC